LDFVLLCAAAFATAVLSAVVGMAGGITLLAAMLLWLPPLVVIPLHGVIQLASNGSRTWFQRRHARGPGNHNASNSRAGDAKNPRRQCHRGFFVGPPVQRAEPAGP